MWWAMKPPPPCISLCPPRIGNTTLWRTHAGVRVDGRWHNVSTLSTATAAAATTWRKGVGPRRIDSTARCVMSHVTSGAGDIAWDRMGRTAWIQQYRQPPGLPKRCYGSGDVQRDTAMGCCVAVHQSIRYQHIASATPPHHCRAYTSTLRYAPTLKSANPLARGECAPRQAILSVSLAQYKRVVCVCVCVGQQQGHG